MNERDNYWTRVAARSLSRRRVLILAGSSAAAAALAACGGDDDDDAAAGGGNTPGAGNTPGSGGTSNAPAPAWANMPVGKPGGKVNIAYSLDVGTLDPHTPGSGGDTYYLNTLFNALVSLDQLKVSPAVGLAEKWEIADPTTINFTLKKGIKFHDGTPFNAEAVKVNVNRILDPALKATWASQLSAVDRVEVVDDSTAKFVLKRPDAALLFALSSTYGAGMISPTALNKFGKDIKSNPVGTGAFTLDRWVPGSQVVVKKNPNYWEKDSKGNPLPYLDEVTISPIPDATVRYANLQTGDATMGVIDSKDVAAAEKNADLVVIKGIPGAAVPALLHYNFAIGPMDNANLRKAIAWSIDPSVIAKNVYFDLAVPADGARQLGVLAGQGSAALRRGEGEGVPQGRRQARWLRHGGHRLHLAHHQPADRDLPGDVEEGRHQCEGDHPGGVDGRDVVLRARHPDLPAHVHLLGRDERRAEHDAHHRLGEGKLLQPGEEGDHSRTGRPPGEGAPDVRRCGTQVALREDRFHRGG